MAVAKPKTTPKFGGPTRITAWSYSRWSLWDQCNARAGYKFIQKLEDPSSPAMERGAAIHKMAENFVKGGVSTLAPELQNFGNELRLLKKDKALTEAEWAYTEKWEPTGWFDRDVWCRIKVDAYKINPKTMTMKIVDHKTGKNRGENAEQMGLYAVGGFALRPDMLTVETELWFLDSGETVHTAYTSKQGAALRKQWEARVKPMLLDTRFAPNPGNHCRWCPYSKAKKGPCKF